MIHLRSIRYQQPQTRTANEFPFSLPIIQSLTELSLDSSVIFLVGENGSGKSTLLEAIAVAIKAITVGSESVNTDPSLADVRKLGRLLRPVWNKRTKKGFFLRAEDFFGYVKRIGKIQTELEQELANTDREYANRSAQARGLARLPYARELHAMRNQYERGLNTYSHGESFIEFFRARFVPNGLYLLDEPETPLSPMRQLAFLALLKQMVAQGGQFLIATHSPILMAFPDAIILNFDGSSIQQTPYEELEHVTITRDFLNNPQLFLQHL